jgi:hypothetical protein
MGKLGNTFSINKHTMKRGKMADYLQGGEETVKIASNLKCKQHAQRVKE